MAVLTLVVGVHEEDVDENKMARVVTDTWECLRDKCLQKKVARDVTEPTDGLRKTWLENKMAL